ncbi:MAG: ABC transporter substrate-binding protein [Candidatus Dormiibacterota bacterium]
MRPRVVVGLATLAVLLGTVGADSVAAAPVKSGGVVTMAEQAGNTPDYISPMTPGSYFDGANLVYFSQLLYRPLYWFGQKGQPVMNYKLSVANKPVFSDNDTVATITLKHWIWSNGQPVTARDVIIWMNLLEAVESPAAANIGSSTLPGPGYGGAVPGGFPSNVTTYQQTGTYTLVLHLNHSYNPTWYTYNELSQVTPIPQAVWDRLSLSGQVGNYDETVPGTATAGALAVAEFVNSQSQDVASYSSSPLWKVVDGPFKMAQLTTSGYLKLVPNSQYSGPDKPHISALEELPFTSDTAEFNALRSGSVDFGYLPTQDIGQKHYLTSHGYTYAPWGEWGFYLLTINFTNPTEGPMFDQLYFRQALQHLINQPEYIKTFQVGLGTVGDGPVPTWPPHNVFESPLEAKANVYPYSASAAAALLKHNGWTVHPGGLSVCSEPGTSAGECGKGIKDHQGAKITLLYPSGSQFLANEMANFQSDLKSVAGIDLVSSSTTESQVIDTLFEGCTLKSPCSNWGLGDYEGWGYLPDYLPTGEEIFQTGATSNIGDYSSATANADILATTEASASGEMAAIYKYEDFIAKQLPVLFLPGNAYQITMFKSDLHGVLPQEPVSFTPEDFYF